MNILFITATRIGDAVLSTGLLDYIAREYPAAKVTIVCGPLCTSLFEGYPNLAAIIPLKKQKFHGHWLKLWLRSFGTRWDMVVDLRNSAVSRMLCAGTRYIFGPHIDRRLHKVEQNAAVMGLADVPAPKLWFTKAQAQFADEFLFSSSSRRMPGSIQSQTESGMDPVLQRDDDQRIGGAHDTGILAVGPTANWHAKTWPVERFIDVVAWMTAENGVMPIAPVAVFAAPGEEEAARQVLAAIPAPRQIDMIAKTDPGTAAAVLSRCGFYLGNDSGLMHCAAAADVPTLGLFGPSYPHLYRPWGDHAQYVSTPETFEELIDYEGYTAQTAPCLMESLSVETVQNQITEIFQKTG